MRNLLYSALFILQRPDASSVNMCHHTFVKQIYGENLNHEIVFKQKYEFSSIHFRLYNRMIKC